jgi:hypothetical protein
MKCVRTYDWDGLDGGKNYIDKENQMLAAAELDEDDEHMQKFKPKSPPMLYAAMFNRR